MISSGMLVVGACLLVGLAVWARSAPPQVPNHRDGRGAQVGTAGGRGGATEPRNAWPRGLSRLGRARRGPPPPIAELLAGLVAELRAGQPTRAALELACADLVPDPCPRARRAAAVGGDVAPALRQDARAPGAGALRGLAACWEVAEHSGAGLAEAVDRLAEGHRAALRADEQLAAEVAAVRASARILALLPAFGLLIGHWIGAQPLAWLTATWPGRVALVVGVGLQAAGLAWLHRMVAGVRRLIAS